MQQQIARLAEGIEATLVGSQPAQRKRKRRWRRGISLWIGIPLVGLVSVVIVTSAGWVGAVRYYDIAEENRLIAEQQGELAAAERELRKELERRDEQLRLIVTAQIEAVAGLLETGRYDRALALLDLFADITVRLDDRDPALAARLRQERIDTVLSLISDAYGSDVDLTGVRTALQELTDPEIVGPDTPG